MSPSSSKFHALVAHKRHATLEWLLPPLDLTLGWLTKGTLHWNGPIPYLFPLPSSRLVLPPCTLVLSLSPPLPLSLTFAPFPEARPGKVQKLSGKYLTKKLPLLSFSVCVCVCSRACAWSLRSESLGALLAERESPSSWTTVTQGPQTAGPTQHGTARFPGSKGFSISKEGLRGPVGGPGPRAVGLGGRGRGAERDW